MKQTDIQIDHSLYVAYAAKYSKTDAANAAMMVDTFKKIIPILKDIFPHAHHVDIRVAPIGKKALNARFFPNEMIIEVDYRLNVLKSIMSLCHEFIHYDQWCSGRLAFDYTARCYTWYDKVINNKGTTKNSYTNQPWEVEAFAKQESIYALVMNRLTEQNA